MQLTHSLCRLLVSFGGLLVRLCDLLVRLCGLLVNLGDLLVKWAFTREFVLLLVNYVGVATPINPLIN